MKNEYNYEYEYVYSQPAEDEPQPVNEQVSCQQVSEDSRAFILWLAH